jgi:HPt (histidine-containing phosphotransfer) domain-containing protein
LARALGPWIPDLVSTETVANERADALFDPRALHKLFGRGDARLADLVQNFADSAAHDIAALRSAPNAKRLAASAHRLRGAARMVGARLLAEQAGRIEAAANAGDLTSAKIAADGIEGLLVETLQAIRSVG